MLCRSLKPSIVHPHRQLVTATHVSIRFIARRVQAPRESASDRGRRLFAAMKKERYEKTFDDEPDDPVYERDESHVPTRVKKKLDILRASLKRNKFEATLAALLRGGFKPDRRTFSALSPAIADAATFKQVESALGIPANAFIRYKFFQNCRRSYDLPTLVKLYEEARREGMVQDWAMTLPLLEAIKHFHQEQRMDQTVDACLRIYRDTMLVDETRAKKNLPSQATDPILHDYFLKAFNIVVYMLSTAVNKKVYFPIARKLMIEAQDMGYKHTPISVTALTSLVMSMAPSYEEALRAYHECHSYSRRLFKPFSYKSFLDVYTRLEIAGSKTSIAPVRGCFEILSHMEEDGYQLEETHYLILISYLNRVAGAIKRIPDPSSRISLQNTILNVTDRTYNHLMAESPIHPSLGLLTQLMGVYGRLGHFAGVAKMWEFINSDALVDNVAVSAIFDACGFLGAYEFAMEVKAKFDRDGSIMNRNNWAAWLECLCRVGQFDEAVRQLLDEAPRDDSGVPDRLSVLVVLGFARKEQRTSAVLEKIRERFPELLNKVMSDELFGH